MKTYNVHFNSEQEKKEFVLKCEADFEKRLDDVIAKAIEANVMNVLLSGPTCAGKTTTANKLIEDFNKCGKDVTIISFDDFFLDRTEQRVVQDGVKIDYDSVEALDLELLADCIRHAKVGNILRVPIYDFLTQKRNGYNEHVIDENEIIVFEGIQAVYPEIVRLFDTPHIGIFINVNDDVCINNVEFTKNEIRFIRRVVRDKKFRGATPDFSFFLWETVRENEEKSIFPNKGACALQIDSFMAYELFLMRDYLIETLSEINNDSKYYDYAQILINKISKLDRIDYSYIPSKSLYTEFLGKK